MLIFLIIHYSPMKLNKFEGNILEKPNSDILLNVIRRHNEFITSDIPNECDKYVPNESNSSHICDVIVSDVGYSPNQCVSSKIPGQWYGVSEETASFPEATTKPVCPDMKFAQVENPNQVQDYSNEYEADACFPFDCFASESSLDESHVLVTHTNAYLSVYSNMKRKRNMYHNFYASQCYMMECLKLSVLRYSHIIIKV
ncbi:uncharacterized protein Smp_200960 [Schistosoma mansoni]|uniref:uncharacterized protein n=1 Tax=Schistosoma mansoni TaxID=6183 RepID=UPI00022DBFE3|nr:uncharacterized protein Smp_200960 [Schistosoma mansoni]|eukprot:XP_018648516.1 uncharacterized protein Smp_200960 [Schistosoma mansoni]